MRIPLSLGRRDATQRASGKAVDPSAQGVESTPQVVSSFLQLVPEPALVVDPHGIVGDLNNVAERLFGRARREVVGLKVEDVITQGWPPSREQPQHATIRRADGRELHVEIVTNRLGGMRSRWTVAILRDVTERVRNDRLMRAENDVLELVASGAALPDILERLASNIEAMSPGWLASILLLGDDGRLHHGAAPSLPEAYVRAIDGVVVGPMAGSCGTAAFRKRVVVVADIDSDPLWRDYRDVALPYGLRACWSSPITTETGDVLGTFALYHRQPRTPTADEMALVSRATAIATMAIGHNRAQLQRFELEARYQVLAELTSDFAYAFSIDERGAAHVDWATDAFTRITGFGIQEWAERGGWLGLLYPDDIPAFEQRLPRLLRGEDASGDVRIVTKDGQIRWLHVYSRPIWDENRTRIAGIVGAAQDFTARKEAEDARTMFLATASHELKTPLTVIQGFAQYLNKPEGGEGVEREAMEAIERRAIQLNKIVDRILLSSRIETGRAPLSLQAVDVLPALTERIGALRAATARDVVLTADASEAVVTADLDAVVTVIDHLLENAVKYSPDGGRVVVELIGGETTYEVRVTDAGIGMTPEQLARCTEKFWQAESTDVRRFGGTGIGLYIVRSLVEAMGGELRIQSAAGAGSTFTVVLRRQKHAIEPAPEQQPGVGASSQIQEFMRQIGIRERRDR